ncbi:MAG TPA: nucleoside-diphosphate sugar epimerase [Lentisphaeria bacterium]|nr:nucleoside-diphosphate sugar epimerase [Lentisphaeria bacterium]HCG49142.1 nucleoside-diphosphate sugar epimerase [Lentisphaeria bacterium]
MKFLITGGAGFIGSHLTESLLADQHRVAVIDDFSTGSPENLSSVSGNPYLEVIEEDITASPHLEQLVREADCIIHLAAAVGVELVVHDPVRTIRTNVEGTDKVLTYAAERSKRCIMASTSEVYGKSAKPFFQETDDLCIGASTNSRWSYACSKLLDEFLLMAFHRNRGLPGTVVRFFNTVGPRQTGRYGMVLPRFVSSALAGTPLKVYGTGEQTRCFCHVQDVIRALKLLIPAERSYGKVFNIGTTRRISIRQLAELVIERAKSSSEIRRVSYEDAYEPGFEDMMNRAPDCTAIRELCGWVPQIELEQIIDDVIAYTKSK